MRTAWSIAAVLMVVAPVARAQTVATANGSTSASIRDLARSVAVTLTERAARTEHDGHALEAEGLYRRAIDADPTAVAGYLGYAHARWAQGERDEARNVLRAVPSMALEHVSDRVQLARAMADAQLFDEALVMLARDGESTEATRTMADIASGAGRLPEALCAARRLVSMVPAESDEARSARRLVRALGVLVGEADAVRHPGDGSTWLRARLAE